MKTNSVKVLSERDHILRRPGVYMGDTTPGNHQRWTFDSGELVFKEINYVPALIKLFEEIISNSIDEAIRTNFNFANNIDVFVREDGKITITDNGRGLPQQKSQQFPKKTEAELAFTQMRAGTNFEDDEAVSIGTNGMGSTLVVVWSKLFEVITSDGKQKMYLTTKDNFSMEAYSVEYSKSKTIGTSVMFTPDYKRLGIKNITDVHVNLIKKRIHDMAMCFPKISFKFNCKAVKSKSFEKYLDLMNVEYNTNCEHGVYTAVLPSYDKQQISFVNGIDTFRGGTHVETARNVFLRALRTEIKRKYKYDIKTSEIKNKINFVIVINDIKTPKFDSQTKEHVTTNAKEYGTMFDFIADKKFIANVMNNIDIITPIIETHRLKQEVAERTATKKANSKLSKKKIATYLAATGKERQKCILHLTEGLSAIGNFVNVRNPEIHGAFPLRGKPKNTRGLKFSAILKNEELSSILSITGLALGEPDISKMNYGKIALLTDADTDGMSIAGLLINFFSHWPDLFKQNRIMLVKSPIVIAKKGKKTERFYDIETFNDSNIVNSGWDLSYNKGLGSLSMSEYDKMINDPIYEIIEWDANAMKSLEIVFGDNADARKTWLK